MADALGMSLPVSRVNGVENRVYQTSGTVALGAGAIGDSSSGPAAPAPSIQVALGTTVDAVVLTAADPDAPPVGTHLLLRILTAPLGDSSTLQSGQVVANTNGETVIETPLGLLGIERRLGLALGTTLLFERLDTLAAAAVAEEAPGQAGGWPALDEALRNLDTAAPGLAQQLRAALSPNSGPALTGTLLYLLAAIYHRETWPGTTLLKALSAAGLDKLGKRLAAEAGELRSFAKDPATGDWRSLTLPVLQNGTVLPVRLFLRRRSGGSAAGKPDEGLRFALEVELSQLGPLQLDGLMRGQRIDLVLRSHQAFPAELRPEAIARFRQALADNGLTGDLSFNTVSRFAVAPLAPLRKHVTVSV
jgi:hypothetical protein